MNFESSIALRFEKLAAGGEPLPLATFVDDAEARLFVNWCLTSSYNDAGIEDWWRRPRTQLEGLCPNQAWPSQPERVIGLAGWLVNRSLELPPETH